MQAHTEPTGAPFSDGNGGIPRRNLTLKEVAYVLGCSPRTLRNALNEPDRYPKLSADLPPMFKQGRNWMGYGPTLEAHIARKERGL